MGDQFQDGGEKVQLVPFPSPAPGGGPRTPSVREDLVPLLVACVTQPAPKKEIFYLNRC